MLIIWNILWMILNVLIVVRMLLKDVVDVKVNGIVLGNVKLKDGKFIKNYVKLWKLCLRKKKGLINKKKSLI